MWDLDSLNLIKGESELIWWCLFICNHAISYGVTCSPKVQSLFNFPRNSLISLIGQLATTPCLLCIMEIIVEGIHEEGREPFFFVLLHHPLCVILINETPTFTSFIKFSMWCFKLFRIHLFNAHNHHDSHDIY